MKSSFNNTTKKLYIQGKVDPLADFEEQVQGDLLNEPLLLVYDGDELLVCHIISAR